MTSADLDAICPKQLEKGMASSRDTIMFCTKVLTLLFLSFSLSGQGMVRRREVLRRTTDELSSDFPRDSLK